MKRLQPTILSALLALSLAAVFVPQGSAAEQAKPATEAEETEDATPEEGKSMSEETATAEEGDDFKQRMHEGDIALGVCGGRVSALLWFYEASVAQGRDDLKGMVESLTESREVIKAEAERRATEDKVDTTVRVMNKHSEELWDDLNEKAAGDADEFQKSHDELLTGVKECLALFFDPEKAEEEEKKEG